MKGYMESIVLIVMMCVIVGGLYTTGSHPAMAMAIGVALTAMMVAVVHYHGETTAQRELVSRIRRNAAADVDGLYRRLEVAENERNALRTNLKSGLVILGETCKRRGLSDSRTIGDRAFHGICSALFALDPVEGVELDELAEKIVAAVNDDTLMIPGILEVAEAAKVLTEESSAANRREMDRMIQEHPDHIMRIIIG